MPAYNCENRRASRHRKRASSCHANIAHQLCAMRVVDAASISGLPPARKKRKIFAFRPRSHVADKSCTPRQEPPTMTRRAHNLKMPRSVLQERLREDGLKGAAAMCSQVLGLRVQEVKFVKRKKPSWAGTSAFFLLTCTVIEARSKVLKVLISRYSPPVNLLIADGASFTAYLLRPPL